MTQRFDMSWWRAAGLLAFAIAVTGCELFADYDAIGTGVEPPDAAIDADANTADAADAEAADADTPDAADADAADADPDTPDAAPAACPIDEPSYKVRPASELNGSASIDGNCSEFSTIAPLPIPPPGTTDGPPTNTTDNDVDCRIVWREASPARLHGCCQVTDDSMLAQARPDDPLDTIYHAPDDRLESIFKCDLDRSTYGCATKLFINNLTPQPTVIERTYRTRGDRDERVATDVEARAERTDTSYVIEWEAEVGFPVDAGDLGLCSLQVFDKDEGEEQTKANAFGAINEISEWACCEFAAQ